MIRRLLRFGVPFGGLELVLAGGAAYFAWDHEQGRHGQPHLLCPICWMDKIAPVAESPEGAQPEEAQPEGAKETSAEA